MATQVQKAHGPSMLSLQYGPGKGVNHPKFTIHAAWGYGNWEDKRKKFYVKNNLTTLLPQFDIKLIAHMEAPLHLAWPNLYHLGNLAGSRTFWKQEWEKHGRYSGLGLVNWFVYILHVYNLIPPQKIRDLGIPAGQQISAGDVHTIIESIYNCKLEIQAIYENGGTGKLIITEIRIHLDDSYIPVPARRLYAKDVKSNTDMLFLPRVAAKWLAGNKLKALVDPFLLINV